MRTNHFILLITLCLMMGCKQGTWIQIAELQVEMRKNPEGIGVTSPRFSWQLHTGLPNVMQKAYQIKAATSPEDLKAENNLLWNSGKWEPLFVYHGFRFVEISGLDYQPATGDFIGKVAYDNMPTTGVLKTSNELVNQIFKNAYWGVRGNYRGMPTDCPQRDERLGWLGDRATGAHGESFIFRNVLLYNKWIKDIEDSMNENGSISVVSPRYWTIYNDDVTWPSTFYYISDMLYRQFGDHSAIKHHYPAMKRWVQHQINTQMQDYILMKDTYGDWCMPPESQELIHSRDPLRRTSGQVLSTTVFYSILQLMSEFAVMNGMSSDAIAYKELSAKIRDAYNRKFFNPETAQYDNNTVTANILSLQLGLVPDGFEERVFANIVDKTENELGGHVSTGVLGIQHLMRGLTKYGRVDLAYRILTNETYPSWSYMIKKDASHQSPYGLIKSEWYRNNDKFTWFITIPANTTATVELPAGFNIRRIKEQPGLLSFEKTADLVIIKLGSGQYEILSD